MRIASGDDGVVQKVIGFSANVTGSNSVQRRADGEEFTGSIELLAPLAWRLFFEIPGHCWLRCDVRVHFVHFRAVAPA